MFSDCDRAYTTTAALSSGQLVVTDATLGGKDDNLTVRADVANGRYVISDPTSSFLIVGTVSGILFYRSKSLENLA